MLIGGFQPFSLSDFPGLTAAIVFTQGCNFRCPYCHNRSLWGYDTCSNTYDRESVLGFLAKRKGKLGGVVVTGGEPTLQKGLSDFLREFKQTGLKVKLDTNGSKPDVIRQLLELERIDYIAMDIKAPPAKYDSLCGIAVDTEIIRESIDLIVQSGVAHHFRTTYEKTLLSEDDIRTIKRILPETSRHIVQKHIPHTG